MKAYMGAKWKNGAAAPSYDANGTLGIYSILLAKKQRIRRREKKRGELLHIYYLAQCKENRAEDRKSK
jgi:hypothetical protein